MKLKMYSVYDCKVEAYLQPFFMRSKGEALRAWGQTVNDEQTQFCRHPADFTLFEIGEFEENSCKFKIYESKIALGTALEFKNNPQGQMPLLESVEKIGQKAGM